MKTNTTANTVTSPHATTTTKPAATTTKPAVTTTAPKPTISVVPPPPTAAPTIAPSPTVAPSTAPPTTVPPTTTPPTTRPPTTTTTPNQAKAAALQRKLLTRKKLGPSNRGIPDDQRFVVSYTPGKNLLITWAIDNGIGPKPTGTPNCTSPPTTPPPTSTSSSTTTTTTTVPTSTTLAPTRTTKEEARYEARQILLTVRSQLAPLKLNISGLQLVGTYPIDTHGESDVVQAHYSKATVRSGFTDYTKAFEVPPAQLVQCLNPAFT